LKKQEKEDEKEKNQKEAEKQQDRDDLLLGVARVLLINMMQDALDRGHTTQAEYEVIDELYKPYIKNGGNGMVKHLFEDRYKHLKVRHE
jgi:imidazole glycerol phosphate synthase subunit HisF